MEGLPIKSPHAIDLVTSKRYLAVSLFYQSKGNGSRLAISIAKAAAFFMEDKTDKNTLFIAAFDRTPEDVTRLLALMPIAASWKGTMLFMRGRPVRWGWDIQRILECYLKSFAHETPDEYCIDTYEYGPIEMSVIQIRLPGEIPVQPPEPKNRPYLVLPCRNLTGWKIKEAKDAPNKRSQLLAHAIEQNVDLCPRFDIDRFADHFDSTST